VLSEEDVCSLWDIGRRREGWLCLDEFVKQVEMMAPKALPQAEVESAFIALATAHDTRGSGGGAAESETESPQMAAACSARGRGFDRRGGEVPVKTVVQSLLAAAHAKVATDVYLSDESMRLRAAAIEAQASIKRVPAEFQARHGRQLQGRHDSAATIIQTLGRGRMVRQQTEKLILPSRSKAPAVPPLQLNGAATIIQTRGRGRMARQQTEKLILLSRSMEESTRSVVDDKADVGAAIFNQAARDRWRLVQHHFMSRSKLRQMWPGMQDILSLVSGTGALATLVAARSSEAKTRANASVDAAVEAAVARAVANAAAMAKTAVVMAPADTASPAAKITAAPADTAAPKAADTHSQR